MGTTGPQCSYYYYYYQLLIIAQRLLRAGRADAHRRAEGHQLGLSECLGGLTTRPFALSVHLPGMLFPLNPLWLPRSPPLFKQGPPRPFM